MKFDDKYNGNTCSIGQTGFIPGVGISLDIRFTRNDSRTEHKIFVPLNKIRLIIPHSADRSWTRILYGEGEYVVVPILYDDLVKYLNSLAYGAEEDNNGNS